MHDHVPGRSQRWATVDTDVGTYVMSVVESTEVALAGSGFVGAYLHGSLAQGSFYRGKSDLDVLFVVEESMPEKVRRDWAVMMCDLSDQRPIVGDVESSVLLRSCTREFRHPLPYEVHYSESHNAAIRGGGVDFGRDATDPDLTTYCTIVRATGVALMGQPMSDVFGPVPVEDFRSAVLNDTEWILEEGNLVESPFYGVLNCCRLLAHQDLGWDPPMTKDAGADWALVNIDPKHHRVVAQAQTCYRSEEPVDPKMRRVDGHDWDVDALLAFGDYVRSRMA